jgi:hypothetical protein
MGDNNISIRYVAFMEDVAIAVLGVAAAVGSPTVAYLLLKRRWIASAMAVGALNQTVGLCLLLLGHDLVGGANIVVGWALMCFAGWVSRQQAG